MTASDGGSSKYYRVEGITFPGFSGIDLLNPPSTFAVYLKDCVMTLSGTLFQWNALGSAPKIYHSNCKLSGASSNNILVFPVELIGSYKFTSGTGTLYWYFKDTLSIGRSGTITKSSTGSYTFNPFTTLELASYSISYNLLYVSTESRSLNLIAVNGAFDGDRNKLLVKDNTGTPVDLVDNMIIQVKGTLVDDTLKALMAS
jgi:hypothetical protein